MKLRVIEFFGEKVAHPPCEVAHTYGVDVVSLVLDK